MKTDKTQIRLLFIADSTSVHTQRWLSFFAARGYEIYLITIGKKRQILQDVHHVVNFDQFYYNTPAFITTLGKARRLIRSIRPDILHAHFAHQYGWLGALSGFHPFILTLWGTDILHLPHASRGKLGKWLTQYALRKADQITVTSEHAKNNAIALGAQQGKIHVIFWGVDIDIFRPDIDVRLLRNQLGIPGGAPVILSNRSYAPLYNNDIVIEAMARVLQRYPTAILLLQNAGGVPDGEVGLQSHAKRLGIDKAVRFLPQYHHDQLPPLYALSDIYVSVPTWDAGPVSLKEAMSSHCAPIISEVPGPMEWVEHGKNGLVVKVRDVDGLASAICDLLENEKKRSEFNKINRALILDRADQQHQMKKAESLYHYVCRRK